MPTAELIDVNQSVLVIIDVQQRLLQAIPQEPREKLLTHSNWLITSAKLLNIPVLVTEQYPKGLGKTDERISQILDHSPVVEKTCFSGYRSAVFSEQLSSFKRKQIVLCGIETHVCVLQTAYELLAGGHHVFLVEDATASRNIQHHRNAVARLANINTTICNVESVMFEWLRDANHSEFKSISRLLK
jgi:nicotinamidase-related amidase